MSDIETRQGTRQARNGAQPNRANANHDRADGRERFLTEEQREELLRRHAEYTERMERNGGWDERGDSSYERPRRRRDEDHGDAWTRPKKRRKRRRGRRLGGVLTLTLLFIALISVGAYFVLNLPKQMEVIQKKSYPMAYVEDIRRHAEPYGLDPARVAAVIFCESSYRPDAVSNVGARGLMQIMPETGEWLATKLNDKEYTPDKLFDPETSLSYGCWYLDYLDERFSGDLVLATAAYHTGQGHVDSWLKDEANSQDGVSLDVIPSSATNTYVNRVLKAYDQYKELYADDAAEKVEQTEMAQS